MADLSSAQMTVVTRFAGSVCVYLLYLYMLLLYRSARNINSSVVCTAATVWSILPVELYKVSKGLTHC